MGDTVPIFVPGDGCTNCWGPGKTFGDIPTNKFLQVIISGVGKGPDWQEGDGEPFNGNFTVTQGDILPCVWMKLWGVPLIYLFYADGLTQLEAKNERNVEYFMTFTALGCPVEISNDLKFHFTGGKAGIGIPGYNL